MGVAPGAATSVVVPPTPNVVLLATMLWVVNSNVPLPVRFTVLSVVPGLPWSLNPPDVTVAPPVMSIVAVPDADNPLDRAHVEAQRIQPTAAASGRGGGHVLHAELVEGLGGRG